MIPASQTFSLPTVLALIAIARAPRVVCAWCADFNAANPKHRYTSHGICPECALKLEREADTRD